MQAVEAATTGTGWPVWIPVIAAIIALVGAGLGVLQKLVADRREAWWKRAQWAMERLHLGDDGKLSADELAQRQEVALMAIRYLSTSRLIGPDEYEFFAEVSSAVTGIPNGGNS